MCFVDIIMFKLISCACTSTESNSNRNTFCQTKLHFVKPIQTKVHSVGLNL